MGIRSLAKTVWAWVGHTGKLYSFYRAIQALVGFGVAGTVTSLLANVSGFLSDMPEGLRRVFFASIGFLILAAVLAVIQWITYQFKPAWLFAGAPPSKPDPLSQQIAENETLRTENSQLKKRLDNAEVAVKNREAWLTPCLQREKYGEDLPVFGPLGSEAYRQMLSAVHELKPSLRETLAGAGAVWDHVAAQIRSHQGERTWDLFRWRLDRAEKAERRYLEQVANSLERVLENQEEDPRPYLAGTYSRYRRWRGEMARVAFLFGGAGSIAYTPASIQWLAAERRFLEELRKKLARPELEEVRKVIDAYEEMNPIEDLSK